MTKKPTANIISNGERLKPIHPGPETRQGYLLLSLLFNITLEVLGMAVRQDNDIKVIYIRKEGVKLSLLADDMILYKKIIRNSLKVLE